MVTRCKYCRAEELFAGECNYDIPSCRDRMLDRERRVVRVRWMVRTCDVFGAEWVDEFWHAAFAHRRARQYRHDGRPARVYRVTVRRKAKR
jgi:hypothetical protein